MPKIDYSKKKFLVIDDMPEFRSSVKRMVESFGGTHVDTSANGEDATEKLMKTKYDIVLSDYNLGGDGKDGQQVLEEAKFRDLLKSSTIYIMLTAESTLRMVMGALEYEPDGYLAKPFNKEMLHNRLEKIAEKKELLLAIYKALDKGDSEQAISLCDAEVNKKSKIMLDCLKIKAKSLLDEGDFEASKAIYEQVLEVKKLPWALMGLGKVNYYSGDYYDASVSFQDIIDENSACVEAYDWLARCKDKLGDEVEAQAILEEAVKISPKAILRQQELGRYARANDDLNVAEKALRHAVKLGKYSCYDKPEIALDLATVLLERCTPDAGIKGKRAGNEALQVLTNVSRKYSDDKSVGMKASLLEAKAYTGLRQTAEAKRAVTKAEKIYSQFNGNASPDTAISLANAYVEMNEQEKASKLTYQIIQENFEDEQLEEAITQLCKAAGIESESSAMIAEEKAKLDDLNKKGVHFFEEGKLDEAVQLFEQAAEDMPNSISVSLNAAQALIRFMEEHGKDAKMLNRCRKYLERVKDISCDDKRYARYKKLLKMHKSVAQS